MTTDKPMRIVFVSGLSGSGRSTAMAALEDLSFYCVDNLPPMLIDQFLVLCRQSTPPIQKVALAIDTREPQFLRGFPSVLKQLADQGAEVKMIYLDCENSVLINRYRETRRVHPLARGGSIEDGIRRERELLADLEHVADLKLDTSNLNVHQLKEAIVRQLADEKRSTVVNVISFGFRYSPPQAAELLFDVRFLPNPYFESQLRDGTGNDVPVADYVLQAPRTQEFLDHLNRMLNFLLPLYDAEGKAYLTIGIGCTGGKHRSVTIVNQVAERLRKSGREVSVTHRDVEKT